MSVELDVLSVVELVNIDLLFELVLDGWKGVEPEAYPMDKLDVQIEAVCEDTVLCFVEG